MCHKRRSIRGAAMRYSHLYHQPQFVGAAPTRCQFMSCAVAGSPCRSLALRASLTPPTPRRFRARRSERRNAAKAENGQMGAKIAGKKGIG